MDGGFSFALQQALKRQPIDYPALREILAEGLSRPPVDIQEFDALIEIAVCPTVTQRHRRETAAIQQDTW
jgi:hypothetical protein